jgi:hypothetical protein
LRLHRLAHGAARLMALVLAASLPARLPADEAAPAMQLPDGPGRTALEKTCLGCHPADRIVAQQRTPAQWQEVMAKMSEQGAMATDEDFQSIYEYLVARYGAPADSAPGPAAAPAPGQASAPGQAPAPGEPAGTQ